MNRRGFSLAEFATVALIAFIVLVAVLGLSNHNATDQQDQLNRELALTLCQDLVDRLASVNPTQDSAAGAGETDVPAAALPADLFLPGSGTTAIPTLFDSAYNKYMTTLKRPFHATVERTPSDQPGLFKLAVSVLWKDRNGYAHSVHIERYCFVI